MTDTSREKSALCFSFFSSTSGESQAFRAQFWTPRAEVVAGAAGDVRLLTLGAESASRQKAAPDDQDNRAFQLHAQVSSQTDTAAPHHKCVHARPLYIHKNANTDM